jgi:hypothetical protein
MECSFCKKQYASIYSLKKHLQTTKSCLALQRVDKTTFTCSFCSKDLSSKIRLDYHTTICKRKKEVELQMKDDEIKKLEQRLEKETVIEGKTKKNKTKK